MPQYEIIFARTARKELEALPHTIRILKKVESLALNPRPYDRKKTSRTFESLEDKGGRI